MELEGGVRIKNWTVGSGDVSFFCGLVWFGLFTCGWFAPENIWMGVGKGLVVNLFDFPGYEWA